MPTVSVNLDTDQYVQVNTGFNPMVLQCLRDSVRITLSTAQPVKTNAVFHLLSGKDAPLHFPSIDTNVWALAITDKSSLIVSQTEPFRTQLIDNDGLPLQTFNGGLDVHVADAHDRVVNEFFFNITATNTTLSVAAAAQDRIITVTSSAGFVVGDSLDLSNGTTEDTTHPIITAIAANVFSLDRPLDSAYVIDSTVTRIVSNMAVDGSITPVVFKLSPHTDENWHVLRFLINMIHSSAADDGKLGSITAVTNGILMRKYDGATGLYSSYTNWKTNGDMALDMYDVIYGDKAGGGSFSTRGRFSIKNGTEAVPKVDEAAGDFLEIVIQDDLTGLTSLSIKAQGHVAGK